MRRAKGARSIEPQTRAPAPALARPLVASSHCYRDRQKIFEKEEEKHCRSKLNLFLSFSPLAFPRSIRGRRDSETPATPYLATRHVCIHDCRVDFLVRLIGRLSEPGNRYRERWSQINRIEFQKVICTENLDSAGRLKRPSRQHGRSDRH